jgi:hypothetical protein
MECSRSLFYKTDQVQTIQRASRFEEVGHRDFASPRADQDSKTLVNSSCKTFNNDRKGGFEK